jgi:predicted nucleotidyltransferase
MEHELLEVFIMDKTVQAELALLRDIIVNTLPVDQIFLFGSYAYGKPHKDSDLDLYVVLKDEIQIRDMDAYSFQCNRRKENNAT